MIKKNKTNKIQISNASYVEPTDKQSNNSSKKTVSKRIGPNIQRLALEQRIVFDAVLPAMAADVVEQHNIIGTDATKDTTVAVDKAITNINEPSFATKTSQANAENALSESTESADQSPALIDGTLAPKNLTAKEIIFIDAAVRDLQQYIADHPNADVVLLDNTKNGLDQIAKVLAGRTGIESIHILSHGSSGELAIGNGVLNIENLLNTEHAEDLATIRNALTADADILIYGCNVAEGSKGATFINALASATGADIAASDDTTGSASLGADWELESQTGEVQSFALAAQAWLSTLDNVVKAQEFTGKGMDFVVIGNSELTQTTIDGKLAFKAAVTPGTATSSVLTTTLLPTTKSIEAVYLYWYGMSADNAPPNTPLPAFGGGGAVTIAEAANNVDTTAVFTLADNSTVTVTADKTFQETNTAGTRTYQGRRADVTELVLGQAGLLTGTYKLDITGGIYENAKTNTKDILGITKTVDGVVGTADPIRAWQMIVVYSDDTSTSASTVQIYDGLDFVQTATEPAIALSGFKVPTTDLNGKLAITTLGGDTGAVIETLATSTAFPDMAIGFANGTSTGTGQGVTATNAGFDVDILAGTNPAGTTSMNLTAGQGGVADRFFIGTAVLKVAAQPPTIDLNGSATGVGFTGTITDDAAGTSPLVTNGRDINDFGENDITTLKVSVGGVLNGASEKITITSGGTVIDIPLNAALAGTPTITFSGVTFKVAFDGSVLTITNNAGATTPMSPVALEALMSGITYSNTAFTTRTGGDRIFNFLAIDNAGLESNPAAAIITVPPPPVDTDGDLVPDAADIDDDNDGILDTAEQVPVTLGTFSAIPAGTYPGLATNQGLRISDTTGQYFVDIYLGPRSSSGAPVVFDIAAKTIGSVDSNVDSNEVVELIYSTDKSPKKFELSSLTINNVLSLTAPLNATGVRDAYAFSAPGTWTPIGTPAGAVVTVNTANADSVGVIKVNDPDGNNVLNNIGKFSQATALDATLSDVLLNMAGTTDGHNVRFDFEAGQVTTSMFLFNSGGGNMLWKFAPAMSVLVPRDSDNDGAPDQSDLDSDNDGISDLYESTGGTGDALADANKNGTISLAEGGGDADKDGLMDIFDANTTSKSGLTSLGNVPIDTDGDSIKDFVDLDSDGDSIADTIEARPTAGYVPNDGAAASPSLDKDGVLGYFDTTNGVGGAFGGNFIDPVNTDANAGAVSDTTPDYLDADSDGDGKSDITESGLPAATTDANKDGITDSVPGASYANPDGNITNPQVTLANEIGDTTQVAYREVLDTDADGIGDAQDIDDDNDGILDTAEQVNVTLDVYTALPANTYIGQTVAGLRLSDATGQYFVDIFVGPKTSAGLPVLFDVANKIIRGDGSALDGTELMELVYTTEKSPKKFTMSSTVFGNIQSFSLPTTDKVRDGYAFSEAGTWTPIGTPAAAVVTVNTANADSVGVFKVNDPDGGNTITNIGQFSQVTAVDSTISDVLTNMAGAEDGHNVRFNFDTETTRASLYVFNTGADGMNWRYVPSMTVVVPVDTDGDGAFDQVDLDSDNDGISDLYESTKGLGDALLDADKNGTISLTEGSGDVDKDGLMDIFDADTTSTSKISSLTSVGNVPVDTDADTIGDWRDLDSDGDFIADTIEARLTAGYVPNNGVTGSPDTDKDGVLGYFDNTNGAGGTFGGNFIDPVNTDAAFAAGNDTTPDYLDLDSDGDGKVDSAESGLPLSSPVIDANKDGMADSVPGVSYANPDGNITNPQTDLSNEIGDTSEVAYREFLDTDKDGVNDLLDLDDDNDGILDTVEENLVVNRTLDVTGAVVTPTGTTSSVVSNLLFGTVTGTLSVTTTNGSGFPTRINQIDVSPASSDFTSPLFTPALGNPGAVNTNIRLNNDAAARVTYTLTLAQPVDNLVMHVALIEGSRWQFTGTQHTESKVSGNASLTYTAGTRLIDNTNNTLFNSNGFASISLTPTGPGGITQIQWTQLDDPNNTAGTADTDVFTFSFTQVLADTDGDGVNNSKELDSDNDGISDLFESTGGTGVALKDTNNDGTITLVESVAGGATGDGDIDNDGLMDIFDANTANITGAASAGTTPINTDGDSRADYLDLDSDGDGIADSIEARPTAGYVSYTGTVDTNDDLDNDGVVDIFDQSNGVGGTFGGNFIAPVNTDALIANNADTKPDYLDTDSDGDGKLDATESGLSTVTTDANGDGIRDSVNASYANPDGAVTTTLAGIFANEVGDTSQVGFRELNLPPVAVTDTINVPENTPTVLNLLANDTDPNGDTLSLKSINGVAIVAGTTQTITVPNGTVTVSTTGVVTFTPASGYNGPVTFPYEVKDPGGLFAAGTVNITVTSVNDTPVAVADTKTVAEDTSATGNVLANDSDPDLATILTVTQFVVGGVTVPVPAGATGGTTTIAGVGDITVKADGSYTFTPVANFNGAVPTITYTVNDGSGTPNATATSTLNITVTAVNDPPVAVNDTISATEDTPIVLPLLTNDTDVDNTNAQLSLKSINGVAVTGVAQTIAVPNGTISITAAGVATFTPNANFNGTVTFPYEVKDPSGLSSQATVTVNVAAVNDAPVAANDNTVTDQNVDVSGNLLTNDTDVDAGTTLTVSAFVVGGEAGPFVVGTPYTIAGEGIITINANGSYTFDPDPAFSGTVPTITYTVSDGNGGTDTAELKIEVNFINTPPEVVDVTATGAEDSTGIVVTLDGTDVDGNFSTFTIPTLPPASQGVFFVTDIITGVTSPVVAGAPFDVAAGVSGLLSFVPGPNFNGTIVVPYIGTDASGADSTPKNITITVTPVNDAPIAVDDILTAIEDTPVLLSLLSNDTDVDNTNAQLSLKSINGTDITPGVAQTINVPNGVVNVTAAGVASFVPNTNYNGPVAFDYVVKDPAGLTDTGSVNMTVVAVNDAPVAAPETASTLEDTPATGNLLTNDSDIDGNPLTVTQFVVDGQTITVPAGGKGTATLTSGVLEIGSDGAYKFTPAANFNGPVPVATYTINDGLTATSTLTLSVTPVNDAPVAVTDTITTPEDTPVTLNLVGNDTDIDGDTLTLKSIDGTNITPGVAQSITVPNGTVNITAAGVVTFTPTANYNGPATFKYLVQDPSGLTSEGAVNITVSPVNDAPVLSPEVDSTLEDTPTTGNLIANDTDIDGNTLTVTQFVVAGQTITVPAGGSGSVTLPSGVIEIGSNGAYTFTPAANFNGAVPQVTYTVSDGTTSGTSTLGITVTPVNDAPVAVDDTVSVTEDTPTTLTLLTNDTDVDGDTPSLKSINGTTITPGVAQTINVPNGTVTVTAAGVVSFTPALNYNGPATFDYVVQDSKGGEDTGTVNITVTPVNDSPVAAPEKTSTPEDTPATGNVLSNDTDIDGNVLKVTQFVVDGQTISIPAGGKGSATLTSGVLEIGSDGAYTFTPAANFNGVVPTVTYTVNDGSGAPNSSATSTLEVTVTPVNDAPLATPTNATGAEDATSIPLNLTGTDIDGTIASVTVTTLPPATQGILQKADGTPVLAGSALTPAEAAGLKFVPAADFNGSVDVVFKVTDNLGLDSSPETAKIVVTPVNDKPVATNASINSVEDIPADVNLGGTDIEDSIAPAVTVTSLPTAAQGVLYFADGVTPVVVGVSMSNAEASTLKFIPALNFNGLVNIGFTVTDSGNDSTLTGGTPLTSSAGNFLIDVANVNDAPSAPNVTSSGAEDTPVSIANLITGVTDTDIGDTVKSATINNLPPASQGILYYTDAGVKTPVVAGTPIPAALIGTLVFEPAPNFNGTVDTIKFTVADQAGELSSPASDLVISITPLNDSPVVAPDFNTVNEDTPATGSVLTNDSDIENDPLKVTQFVVDGQTITVPTGGSGTATIAGVGTLVMNDNGSYTFTPALNFNGTVPSVTYTVSDSNASNATSSSTLDITVTAVNDAPIATPSTLVGTEDTNLSVNLAGTDADGTIASVTVDVLPPASQGVLTKANGSPVVAGVTLTPSEAATLIFKPALNFNGAITPIEFKVTDNQGLDSATVLVNISLSPVNDAPIATAVTPSGNEDTPITINFGGTDVEDGIPATVTITSLPPASKGVLYLADGITPVAVNTPIPAGDLIFKPALNYNTATDGPLIIPFTVTDSGGLVSTPANASVTINAVNDAPIGTPTTPTGNEDTPIAVSLAGTDVDGTIASITITELPPANEGVLTLNGTPVAPNQVLSPTDAANLVFTPALDFNGQVTPIKFTVKDNLGIDSTPATSTITVTAVNDAPIATPVTPSGDEDTPITINLAGSDVDGTVDTVTVTALPPATKGVLYLADGTTPVAANTPLTAAQAAGLVFKPAPNYNTAVDGPIVVPFKVTDNNGAVSTSSTASITVNDINDVPVATSKSVDTPEDTNVGVNLSGTDIDGTITSVTVTQLPDPAEGILYFADGVTPVQANVPMTPAQAASLIFNPTVNYNSTDFNLVEIKFTVTDEDGGISTPATFVIDIGSVNDSPLATAVSTSTPEDTPVTITLDGTDVDIGDAVVSVSLVTLPSPAQGILYLTDGTTLVVAGIDYPPGSFVFKPAPNFNGTVPPFNFTVKDTVGQVSTPAAINFSVGDVNDLPTAIDAVTTGNEDTPVSVSLVGNDIDGTIASLTITDVPPAAQGVLTKADGTVVNANDVLTPTEAANLTFTPAANFNGAVTPITFTVTDDDGGVSPLGTATLTVTAVNDPPVATTATVTGDEDTPIPVALTGSDVEGPIASVTITSLPPANKGVLTLNGVPVTANQVLTPADAALLVFTPTPNSNGPATFTFTVTDSEGTTSSAATATVNVTPVNDTPIATPSTPIGNEDTPIPVSLTGSDVEGPIASVTVTAVPPASEGVLTKADGTVVNANDVLTPTEAANLVFTPAANFNGAVTPISFIVTDSNGTDSPPATSTITVTPVNDPPVATPATATVIEDSPITIALTGTDIEGPIASVTITSLPPASKGVLTLNGVPVTAGQILTPADAANLVFTPALNSNGPATFAFTVTDSQGTTSPAATATVNVTPVNDVPVATPATPIGNEDTPIPVSLTGTDVEGPITSVTVTAVPPANEGVLTLNGVPVTVNQVLTPAEAASLIFTPAANFNGPVTPISFTVTDSNGIESPPATSTITVIDVVNPPVASPVKLAGSSEQPISVKLSGSDRDGTITSVTIKSLPPTSEGVLTLLDGTPVSLGQVLTPSQAASLRFKAADGFNGTSNIGFTVTDDEGLESAIGSASLIISSDNGLFEQLVSPPLKSFEANGRADGNPAASASTLGFSSTSTPAGNPVTEGLLNTNGLVSQVNTAGVFSAAGPDQNEINGYSSDLNTSAQGTSQGLFVQHAVRGLPVTSEVNIFVQNAVRQSQIESMARNIGVSSLNTATNAVTSLIMPFELGAPNQIETDFTVNGAFDNDQFEEELKKKSTFLNQPNEQEILSTLSNTQLVQLQDASKIENEKHDSKSVSMAKMKQKQAATSFGKQVDLAAKKLKAIQLFS